MRNALAILVAGTLLAACGQRGPLYLPGEDREEVPPAAAPAPATAAGTTTEEDEAARRNRPN